MSVNPDMYPKSWKETVNRKGKKLIINYKASLVKDGIKVIGSSPGDVVEWKMIPFSMISSYIAKLRRLRSVSHLVTSPIKK